MKKAVKALALALAIGGVLAVSVAGANFTTYDTHPAQVTIENYGMQMDGLEEALHESFDATFVEQRLNGAGEADSAKWITIDGNGDGHKWYHSSLCSEYHSVAPIDSCHEEGYMMSESYCNAGGALSPDDYLVTPEIQLGKGVSYMTFNAVAQDSNYKDEKYTVAVYVVGEGDALDKNAYADLTDNEGIVLPDRSASNPGEQVFDLSAYAGKKVRLAVHHHNTWDQFILCVDCVTVWTAPIVDEPQDVVPKNLTGFSYFRTAPIFFNTNGGSKISTITRAGGAFVNLAKYVPVKEGYVFTGWYTDEALTKPIKSFYASAAMKLYAGWEEIVEEPALTEEEETAKAIPEI